MPTTQRLLAAFLARDTDHQRVIRLQFVGDSIGEIVLIVAEGRPPGGEVDQGEGGSGIPAGRTGEIRDAALVIHRDLEKFVIGRVVSGDSAVDAEHRPRAWRCPMLLHDDTPAITSYP